MTVQSVCGSAWYWGLIAMNDTLRSPECEYKSTFGTAIIRACWYVPGVECGEVWRSEKKCYVEYSYGGALQVLFPSRCSSKHKLSITLLL